MITNKIAKPCESCKETVQVGAGYAFKNRSDAYWRTVCSSKACHEALGLIEARARRMSASGLVTMPKDPGALPLLRSLPGARWDMDARGWHFSLAVKDRERVLEIGRQLKLNIDPALLTYELPREAEEAKSRAAHPGLYPFQRAGVEFLALHDRALLADDMGLGKTVQALCALPAGKPAIVICPASVKLNWRDECKRWRPDLEPTVLEGKKSFRGPREASAAMVSPTGVDDYDVLQDATYAVRPELLILNDDILPDWLVPVTGDDKSTKIEIPEGFDLPDVTLVVDEAHRAKNYKAKRSKKVSSLARLCARSWFLTGTPLLNHPPDLFGVLEAGCMAREVFGSFKRFQALFNARAVRHGRAASAVHTEYGDPQPEVAERLKRSMLRRTKAEALPDLPRKVYQEIPVNGIPARTRAELDALWEEYGEVLEATGELPAFSEFSAVRAKLAELRVDAMVETVESYEDSGTPLVVFSAHRSPIDALASREGWAVIHGDVPAEERQAIVKQFQAGELRGIGLTIQAGGVGLTLTRASHVLFVDLDWTPALNAQAEDRVCRIGQTAGSIQVMRMVSDHPLDKRINRLLAEKIALIEKAIDSKLDYQPKLAPFNGANTLLHEESADEMQARRRAIEDAARAADARSREEKVSAWVSAGEAGLVERKLPPARVLTAAYEHMSALCDGAVDRDGQGFNKPDAARVHFLASFEGMNRDRALWMILRRYPRQLAARFPELFDRGWSAGFEEKGAEA